jgi:hypothetical protein
MPLLVASWFCLTLLFAWVFQRFGAKISARQFLAAACMLYMCAWMLLDVRWTANNLRQIHYSLETRWRADEQQKLSSELDGGIYQYVQRLKAATLGNKNARILVIGNDGAIDYYLLRAKYHLLPHSVNVAGGFAQETTPDTLDFVIYFGAPDEIDKVPGWNQTWQNILVNVDNSEWGAVFRVRKP